MNEHEVLVMSKTYGKHRIIMIIDPQEDRSPLIAQCKDCQRHMHKEVDFGNPEETMMLDAEFQLHASGVNDGWLDGFGFSAEEVDSLD